ncbi:MAG: hypothetical protein JWP97_6816 [Labilithrix sp.]|nr:hypothetical protein [Labilithrix sp.]
MGLRGAVRTTGRGPARGLARLGLAALLAASCSAARVAPSPTSPEPPPPPPPAAERTPAPTAPVVRTSPSFAEDLAFLEQHGAVHVLEAPGGGRVAVSPGYQGRVMTSAVDASGASFGWVNRSFIVAGKTGTPFDNYGGEDRLWLGPEGGQLGLYFPPGAPFTFDRWQVPAALQEGAWDMAVLSPTRVRFKRSLTVKNWSGTSFALEIERTVGLVERRPEPGVRYVAFETVNRITNRGKAPWKRESGLLSLWVLGQLAPSDDARVIVPFETGRALDGATIVNDTYFGKVPAARLEVHEDAGYLLFTCDGKERGKIGLGPARARPSLGSYSRDAHLLTVVEYDGPKRGGAYVNSTWEQQKQPFAGDVVNSYNDGPVAPGQPALGGFYEIETSSPGAELGVGQSLVHTHRTFHFVGDEPALEPVAKKLLGVSLARM